MTPAGLAVQAMCLFSVFLFLQGCPSKPRAGVRFPITSGSHTILPATEQRILIWADAPLTDVAVEWLEAHHYSNILVPDKTPLHPSQISHNFSHRQAALVVAESMKAEFVLFLDRDAMKDGALIESHCGPLFNVSVEVRGLGVETGNTASLRGSAHYPQCVDLSDKTIRSLSCQALATAWGFRPSGQLDIPSSLMCTTGQTAPTPTR